MPESENMPQEPESKVNAVQPSTDTPPADTPPIEKTAAVGELTSEERHKLVQEVITREIFIDPLSPEEILRAYQVYHHNTQKMIDVLLVSFQSYCRKCLQETAVIAIKNELSQLYSEEAEVRRNQAIHEIYEKIKVDSAVERLLMMLLFKNHYWQWVSFGLKEIFKEQRLEPGNNLNNILNTRFHQLKQERSFKTVGELVLYDITDMVNLFKVEVMKAETRIFS